MLLCLGTGPYFASNNLAILEAVDAQDPAPFGRWGILVFLGVHPLHSRQWILCIHTHPAPFHLAHT